MIVPMADLQAQHRKLKDELIAVFEQSLESCDFGGLGRSTGELEKEIAGLCDAQYGLGVNSGTDALLLALLALGIGPGDEVITTPFTMFATAETISLAGATPVFADIDPQTFNLDPQKAAARITSRTKAIMPVHLFGQLADMRALSAIAKDHGLALIADAAQAIGATLDGRAIGHWCDTNTLSFYPTKNLGACGDAGMILTNRADIAEKVKLLRFHGSGGTYYHRTIGYCSRLDGIQSAILRLKAKHLAHWNESRRANAAVYREVLADLTDDIRLPLTAPGNHHIYHQYTVRVTGGRRDSLQKHLSSHGVQSAIYYPLALHLQEAYVGLGYKSGDLPASEEATRDVLSLPVHAELTPEQVQSAANAVRSFFR